MYCVCGEKIDNNEVSRRRGSNVLPELCPRCRYKHIQNESSKKYNKKMKLSNSRYIEKYLKNHPCVDCGETDPACLTFDHVHGSKCFDVGHVISRSYKTTTIAKEIEKCEVRCFNCHMLKTAKSNNWWVWRRHYENQSV